MVDVLNVWIKKKISVIRLLMHLISLTPTIGVFGHGAPEQEIGEPG